MRIAVVSDIHYAGPAEKALRGWERRAIGSTALRWVARCYRRYVWLEDPTAHNHQLDAFIAAAGEPDLVIANGDYSCDNAFIGLADDAAHESAQECVGRLRSAFGDRLHLVMGDHELGKMSLFGGRGGLRLASWKRATHDLGISPFWSLKVGQRVLMGVTSSILALPVFQPEILPEERAAWEQVREEHLRAIAQAFEALQDSERVVLFCHDPTALAFLAAIPAVERRRGQIERTIIGHLHSELVYNTSRCLAGMPTLERCGHTARRLSKALAKARGWGAFRLTLCPATAGIQLLKDGGYLELTGDGTSAPFECRRGRLPWPRS